MASRTGLLGGKAMNKTIKGCKAIFRPKTLFNAAIIITAITAIGIVNSRLSTDIKAFADEKSKKESRYEEYPQEDKDMLSAIDTLLGGDIPVDSEFYKEQKLSAVTVQGENHTGTLTAIGDEVLISDTDYASMILCLDTDDYDKKPYLWFEGYHKSNPEFEYMLYDGVSDIYDDNRVADEFDYCISEISVNGNKIEDGTTCWGVNCHFSSRVMFFNNSRSETSNQRISPPDLFNVSSLDDLKQVSGKITFFDNQGRVISEDTFDVSVDFNATEFEEQTNNEDDWDFDGLFGF